MNERKKEATRKKAHSHTTQTHTFEALQKVNRQKYVHEHALECLAASLLGTNHFKRYSIQMIHVGLVYLSEETFIYFIYENLERTRAHTIQ